MVSIVIPTFNEKNNIEPLFNKIQSSLKGICEFEVIFIDDSKDETPLVLEKLRQDQRNVSYQHRTTRKGLASAVVDGLWLAKGDIIAVMDADLQHPPSLLPKMYHTILGGADIVLPSRYIDGGEKEGLSPIRQIASSTAILIGRMLLKSLRRVTDPTSGFFMLRKEVIEERKLRPVGWKILIEILVMGQYETVVEIPYVFQKRNANESKMSLKVTLLYFFHIIMLIFRSEKERRFYLFMLVGLSGVLIDMLMFLGLSTLWPLVHPNFIATLSAFAAMISNYILNRTFTWRTARSKTLKKIFSEFLKYIGVCLIGVLVKNVCLFFLFNAGLSGTLANFIGILAASLLNYFFSDRWVFANKQDMQYRTHDTQSNLKG